MVCSIQSNLGKPVRTATSVFRGLTVLNLKTSESWLRFAKYHPPKYIRKRLLIPGYDIANKDHWQIPSNLESK